MAGNQKGKCPSCWPPIAEKITATKTIRYVNNKNVIDRQTYTKAASVHCRLDYCNAVLAETADSLIKTVAISLEYRVSLVTGAGLYGPVSLF